MLHLLTNISKSANTVLSVMAGSYVGCKVYEKTNDEKTAGMAMLGTGIVTKGALDTVTEKTAYGIVKMSCRRK